MYKRPWSCVAGYPFFRVCAFRMCEVMGLDVIAGNSIHVGSSIFVGLVGEKVYQPPSSERKLATRKSSRINLVQVLFFLSSEIISPNFPVLPLRTNYSNAVGPQSMMGIFFSLLTWMPHLSGADSTYFAADGRSPNWLVHVSTRWAWYLLIESLEIFQLLRDTRPSPSSDGIYLWHCSTWQW